MAGLLIQARDAASTARQAGQSALDAVVLEDLVARYRALAAAGLAANLYRRTATATDARRIARRFLGFEDLILRFATRPDLDISPITKQSGRSGRSRSSSAAPEDAGGPSTGSRTSHSSSPAYPPPPNGASANSMPSATCSTAAHGSLPASNPPDNVASAGPPQGFRSPARPGIIYPWTATGTVSSPGASRPWATWSKDDPDPSRRSGHTPVTW